MQRTTLAAVLSIFLCTPVISEEAPTTNESLSEEEMEQLVAGLQALLDRAREETRKKSKSEPTLCYRLIAERGNMTVGLTVELCSGTTNAQVTVACFDDAFAHPDDGGLGLNRGLAVDLCKSNQESRDVP